MLARRLSPAGGRGPAYTPRRAGVAPSRRHPRDPRCRRRSGYEMGLALLAASRSALSAARRCHRREREVELRGSRGDTPHRRELVQLAVLQAGEGHDEEESDHDLVYDPRVRVDPVAHPRKDDPCPLAEQEEDDRWRTREQCREEDEGEGVPPRRPVMREVRATAIMLTTSLGITRNSRNPNLKENLHLAAFGSRLPS